MLQGQRIFLFGGGKYKTPEELAEAAETPVSFLPSIDSDVAMVLFQDATKTPPEETYQTVYGTISTLIAKGLMKEPLIPFHVINTKMGGGDGVRTKYEITPTKERIWVANRTPSSFKDQGTPHSYTTIGAALDAKKLETLPNELCQAKQATARVHHAAARGTARATQTHRYTCVRALARE